MATVSRCPHHWHSSNMALSSGRLVTSTISPRVGKGDKTLLSSIDLFKGLDNDILTGILSRLFLGVIGAWARLEAGQYSRGCSQTVRFVFEQSGSPFPTRGLIVLVTRRPELSAIFELCQHRGPTQSVWVAVYSKCTRFTVCLTYSRHISLTLYENQW